MTDSTTKQQPDSVEKAQKTYDDLWKRTDDLRIMWTETNRKMKQAERDLVLAKMAAKGIVEGMRVYSPTTDEYFIYMGVTIIRGNKIGAIPSLHPITDDLLPGPRARRHVSRKMIDELEARPFPKPDL